MPISFDSKLTELPIAVFDLETTGLFPSRNHIVQIALVPIDAGSIASGGDMWLVNPGDDVVIPDFVLELTNLPETEIRKAPKIDVVLPQFGAAVGSRIVAGHNVKQFDLPFVRRAEQRLGIDVQTDLYIDTLLIARKLDFPDDSKTLGACGKAYGIDFDESSLHDALADTRLCAEVLLNQFADLEEEGVTTFGDLIGWLTS